MGIFLNGMVLLFALLMGYISFYHTIVFRDEKGKFQGIATGGKFLLLFLILALGFGGWKVVYDEASSRNMNNQIADLGKKLLSQDTAYNKLEAQYRDLKSDNAGLRDQITLLEKEGKANLDTLLKNPPKAIDAETLQLTHAEKSEILTTVKSMIRKQGLSNKKILVNTFEGITSQNLYDQLATLLKANGYIPATMTNSNTGKPTFKRLHYTTDIDPIIGVPCVNIEVGRF